MLRFAQNIGIIIMVFTIISDVNVHIQSMKKTEKKNLKAHAACFQKR